MWWLLLEYDIWMFLVVFYLLLFEILHKYRMHGDRLLILFYLIFNIFKYIILNKLVNSRIYV